jgi:peptidoglycan-associated lipoprotein
MFIRTYFKETSMKRILLPLLLMATLSGCETLGLGDDKAAVEDRNAQQAKKQTSTAPASGASSKGVETSGLGSGSISGQALDGSSLSKTDVRKDPASPLSKRSVYFDYDSFAVKDDYRGMIEAHAGYLNSHRKARIIVQGNADERGSREYNLALGQKRAEAVRKALALLGVTEEQLEAISFGEEKPRAVGTSEQDYAENRRADIVYGDE